MGSLRVMEINDVDRFFELKGEWNRVLEKSSDNHVLLTWEFMSTYVKHFGDGRKLKVLCIKDGDRTIAIAPLRLSRYNLACSFSYNAIEPLAYMHADYTGLILSEREAKCLKLLLQYLFQQGDWDFIYLYDIPGSSILLKLLPKISREASVTFEFKEGVICPYLEIPKSTEVLMSRISASLRRNIRRYLKKLEKDYGRVELKRYDEIGSVEQAMHTFICLHQKKWQSQGMPGVYNNSKRINFSLDAANIMANRGWLALYFLTANGEPVAGLHCLEYNRVIYGGLSGFDPAYAKYSVGNLAIIKLMEKCVGKGIKEFDFMKGAEPYKFNWTKTYRRNFGVRFVNKRLNSAIYDLGIKAAKCVKIDRFLGRFLEF
ncbi:MAG: GNAT family N-acetyltransferase [Candidatus Bathyarchaeia archaeon]